MLSVKKYIIRREKRISREKIAQILEETDIPSGSDISGISDNGDRDQEWLPVRPEVISSSDDEELPLAARGEEGEVESESSDEDTDLPHLPDPTAEPVAGPAPKQRRIFGPRFLDLLCQNWTMKIYRDCIYFYIYVVFAKDLYMEP